MKPSCDLVYKINKCEKGRISSKLLLCAHNWTVISKQLHIHAWLHNRANIWVSELTTGRCTLWQYLSSLFVHWSLCRVMNVTFHLIYGAVQRKLQRNVRYWNLFNWYFFSWGRVAYEQKITYSIFITYVTCTNLAFIFLVDKTFLLGWKPMSFFCMEKFTSSCSSQPDSVLWKSLWWLPIFRAGSALPGLDRA